MGASPEGRGTGNSATGPIDGGANPSIGAGATGISPSNSNPANPAPVATP